MSAPGGFNYPPELIPVMERFVATASSLLPLAEDTKRIADGVVAVSAGQTFVAFQAVMTKLVEDMKAQIAAASAFGRTSIQAGVDMHDRDRRGAMMFE